MQSRDGSRSTLKVLLAGTLTLAFSASALGQSAPTPAQQPPAPPAASDGSVPMPASPGAAPSTPSTLPNTLPPTATTDTSAQNNAPTADTGLLAYSLASVPDMMGDSRSGGMYNITLGTYLARGAAIPIAGGDGYAKIADDTSPIPTDRVFFDYDYFNHAVGTSNNALIGLNRYNFGVEKTFLDGLCSIEVQAPLVTGLNNDQNLGGTTGENEGTLFGNMSLTLKCLVYYNNCFAVSAGTMVDLPTSPNATFTNGIDTLTFGNNSVHVAPFLGFAYAPCCGNFFATGFVQADFDTNGDPVDEHFVATDPRIGTFRDPSLLYLDLSMGYWLFRQDQLCCRYLTGIAPVVELHYTTTMQNYRGVDDAIAPVYAGTDCLDLTAGVHFQMGPCSMLTVGGVVPLLTSARDREFDSEVVVQLDRRF